MQRLELIEPQHAIGFIGSCFSEHVANAFSLHGFHAMKSPSGILFNPISIAKFLHHCIHAIPYEISDLIHFQNHFYAPHHHGSFHHENAHELLKNINEGITSFHRFLHQAQHLFITLGSAKAWTYLPSQKLVGNCFKIPASYFSSEIISSQEIISQLNHIINELQLFNPSLKIHFTISPVKHLKMGLVENALSKSILRVAIYEIEKKYSVTYFPAFEMVQEELRDYRFYASDLAHPSDWTIQYIIGKCATTYFNQESIALYKEADDYVKLSQHRPLENSKENLELLEKKKNDLKLKLLAKYPYIHLE